jgi:tetratricopeptide (TPR) repeat protein
MTPTLRTALSADRPFPGLRPYAFEDSHFYFGREDQIYSLYRLLDRSQFIAVVGSSGSGKSSLVRAGLLPLLDAETKNAGGRSWRWVEMRPGDAPLKRLAAALASLLPEARDDVGRAVNAALRERIGFALRQSSFGLVEALDKIEGFDQSSFVLVVDQFEELFRYAPPATGHTVGPGAEVLWREDAAHFVQLLLEISRRRTRTVQIVITMRSDFIGDCSRFHGLPEAVSGTQFLVPSLTRDQREDVVRKPVEKAAATIDPILVERLLNDSGDELDQLPVVQHCLMRLWDRAGIDADESASDAANAQVQLPTTRHLTLEHYRAIGGIAGALSQHAEEILTSLTGSELAVEQTFRTLAEIDREGRAIRRAVRFGQLLAETGIPEEQLRRVIDRLRGEDCSFVVPSPSAVPELAPDTRIDVGHEALLRRWARLSGDLVIVDGGGTSEVPRTGWLREEDADGRLYRGLLAFVDSEGSSGTTLPLDQVEPRWKWWTSRPHTEAWAKRYGGGFDRVRGLFKNSLATLALAREAAEREAVSRRRRWLSAVGGLSILVVVALGTAFSMYTKEQAARRAQDEALRAQDEALRQTRIAENALFSATKAANVLVLEFSRDFGNGGLPTSLVLKILERAQALQHELESAGAMTPELKYGKAMGLNEFAVTLARLGGGESSVSPAEEARTILEGLLREQPSNPEWLLGLARSHHARGFVWYLYKKYENAVEAYRKGLAIRAKLAETDLGNAEWQGLVAESHSAIGDALLDSSHRAQALETYRKGQAIAEKLAADYPRVARWRARLSTSYVEVATALPADHHKERREFLLQAITLAKNATDDDPGNREWQRDLSVGYGWLIKELVATKDHEAALNAATEAMKIVDDLLNSDLKDKRWQEAFFHVYRNAKNAFLEAHHEEKVREIDDKVDRVEADIRDKSR